MEVILREGEAPPHDMGHTSAARRAVNAPRRTYVTHPASRQRENILQQSTPSVTSSRLQDSTPTGQHRVHSADAHDTDISMTITDTALALTNSTLAFPCHTREDRRIR